MQQLAKLTPTEEVLQESGIGHIVGDRHLWILAGHTVQRRAAALQAKWRVAFRRDRSGAPVIKKPAPVKPFAGLGARGFLAVVQGFVKELAACIPDLDKSTRRALAVKSALMGFTELIHLAGTLEDDVHEFMPSPALRSSFMTLVRRADAMNKMKSKRQVVVFAAVPASKETGALSSKISASSVLPGQMPASAVALADKVKNIDADKLQVAIVGLLGQWDVPLEASTPTAAVQSLVAAHAQGHPVADVLLAKAAAHRLEAKRLSKAQVASALRLWHEFSVHLLGYQPSGTLPPREGTHVEAFLGIFRNPATAANYVSHLRWACIHLGLRSDWDTEALKATIKGAKRRRLRLHGGPSGAKRLMTRALLRKVIMAADEAGLDELPAQCLLSWHFLLRVQSECIPLEVGQPQDFACLAPHRHSAVWVDGSSNACMRLRMRKNRPQGSFLKRPCTCHTTGRQLCVAHRLQDLLHGKPHGARLWASSSHLLLTALRKILKAVNVVHPEEFTFKAFRAGHATALAEEGKSIGDILNAGEWRSAAFLSYIDEDIVDASQVLEQVLCDSDCE